MLPIFTVTGKYVNCRDYCLQRACTGIGDDTELLMLACVSYATGVLLLSLVSTQDIGAPTVWHVVQQPGQILSLDKVCGAAHPSIALLT